MATSPSLSQVLDQVTTMYQVDRQLTANAIAQMHQDLPRPTIAPSLEIPDLEQRKQLFRRYASFCSRHNLAQPNTVALCLFLIVPVSNLRAITDVPNIKEFAKATHELFNQSAYIGIKTFLARSSYDDKAKSTSPDSSPRITSGPSLGASARGAAMVSSPLARAPMRASPSKKRKAPASDFDGPSSRTRLRTRHSHPPTPAAPAASAASGPESPRPSPSVLPSFVPGSPFAPPSPTPSFVHPSRSAVAAARTRDHDQCILTGHPLVQAAHIYPFSATKLAYECHAATGTSIEATNSHAAIGSLLQLWGDTMTDAWRNACNDKAVSETAQNLLCMDYYLHALWGRALFGLEPLTTRHAAGDGDDGGEHELDLRFHWLRRGARLPRDGVDVDDLDAAVAAVCGRPGDDPAMKMPFLAHRQSGVPLQTGHIFTIRADSLDKLPSFALLEVRWHLTRLAAMCGAANVDDDYDDEEEDESNVQGVVYKMDGSPDIEPLDADIEPLDLNV